MRVRKTVVEGTCTPIMGMFLFVCTLALTCVLAAIPSVACAQGASASAKTTTKGTKASNTVDPAAVAAGRAKADTGRMMPGYRDLSRYDTPGYCLAAMIGMKQRIWRRGEGDTLPKWTQSDTTPTAARDLGRQCLAKLTPSTVARTELRNLLQLNLWVADTTGARQTLNYHLSTVSRDSYARAIILRDAAMLARDTRPVPMAFLESLPSLADTLDAVAAAPIHVVYRLVWAAALNQYDTAAMIRWSAQNGAFVERLTPQQRSESLVMPHTIVEDSLEIAWMKRPANLPAVVGRLGDKALSHINATGIDLEMWKATYASLVKDASFFGMSAPTLRMFQRYPDDTPLSPIPGRVTIVFSIRNIGEGKLDSTMATLRRLHERYHTEGLDIVLVARTKGYIWKTPPIEAGDEAKLIGWYYRDHLKLPFPVLVERTTFGRRADGRLEAVRSPFLQTFQGRRLNQGYMVARDGTLVAIDRVFSSEAQLEAYVRRELALPAPAKSATR